MSQPMPPERAAPRISVVIPTCNRNDSLARCLEALDPSKQGLSEEDFEVVVSDDSSRGSAVEMIRQKFPWVRWIQGPRKGPAANRNNGAASARAEWLAFTDDDCVPDAGWLRCYLKAVSSGRASVYEGRTYTEPNTKGPFWGAPSNENGGLLWSCNLAIRKDLFHRTGGFDALFPYPHMEDVDFRERIKAAGQPFVFLREAGIFHPLRPVAPISRQAMGHESYFYYARKHGLSLKQSGLSLRAYVKARLLWFESSRGVGDTTRFVVRSIVEAAIVSVMTPGWLLKFRSVKKQS